MARSWLTRAAITSSGSSSSTTATSARRSSSKPSPQGRQRDFFGFNRGKHAVVEAAILATRVAFLPRDDVLAEFRKLAVLVDKTGGPRERAAFTLLHRYVHEAPTPPGLELNLDSSPS